MRNPLKITLKSDPYQYLLFGDLTLGGPISTLERFALGECSFAHLFMNGRVMRFGEQIGCVGDITVLGKYKLPAGLSTRKSE